MKLEEAIKKLEDLRAGDLEVGRDKAANAEALGIEALKRCKEARTKVYFTSRSLLPGETKE